jgi:hypothetical protein
MNLATLTQLPCKGCGQILALTDGRVLIFGGTILREEVDATALITHSVTLTCPRKGCRRTRGWQPLPGNGHQKSGQKGNGRAKSP